MTNVSADSANDTARPVSDFQNRNVNGEAMTCKPIFDDHVRKVAALRDQQEAYLASLPKDAKEALADINRTLIDLHDIGTTSFAARAALTVIHELAIKNGLDDSEEIRDALYWLTSQGLDGLKVIEDRTRRAKNIAYQFTPSHMPYKA